MFRAEDSADGAFVLGQGFLAAEQHEAEPTTTIKLSGESRVQSGPLPGPLRELHERGAAAGRSGSCSASLGREAERDRTGAGEGLGKGLFPASERVRERARAGPVLARGRLDLGSGSEPAWGVRAPAWAPGPHSRG
jgi:hypothetical protein